MTKTVPIILFLAVCLMPWQAQAARYRIGDGEFLPVTVVAMVNEDTVVTPQMIDNCIKNRKSGPGEQGFEPGPDMDFCENVVITLTRELLGPPPPPPPKDRLAAEKLTNPALRR